MSASVDFDEPSPKLHRETRKAKDIDRRRGSSLHNQPSHTAQMVPENCVMARQEGGRTRGQEETHAFSF
jgi:hypothetical protein